MRFSDFAIGISQDDPNAAVTIKLVNDRGEPTAVISVGRADDEWIGAVSLINSADLKVKKVGQTLGRAMEELGRAGTIGIESDPA